DSENRLQREGEIGEIAVAGSGLARGYLNDPQLTRRSFIELLDTEGRTTRLYKTGDLGRWSPGGKLEFHGRVDHQVKINGFRIELAEVEFAIRKFPAVADGAVLAGGHAIH